MSKIQYDVDIHIGQKATLRRTHMRLSRTGWNNVIIFSVMGFILLINATNQRLFPSKQLATDAEVELLTETQLILTMEIAIKNEKVLTIERIGQTWRASPANIHGQALDEMIRSWQSATGDRLSNAPNVLPEQAINVSLMIAGRMTAFKLNLYLLDDVLIIYNQSTQQWISLPEQMANQLLPLALFNPL